MPKLPNDADPDPNPNTNTMVSLTVVQYLRMMRWAAGEFEADWTGAEPTPLPLDELPDMERPQALDRAALEACVGGGFFPGIEVGQVMLEETTYDRNRPFRINVQRRPGELTARMAVPWQADFRDCSIEDGMDWWPGQRPNQVLRGEGRGEWIPPSWHLPLPEEPEARRRAIDRHYRNMVDGWSQLGFVVEKMSTGRVEYVEDERDPDLR